MIKKDPKVKRPKATSPAKGKSKMKAAVAAAPCPDVVLENISDNIIQLDLQNRVTWANPAAVASLGRKADDIIGQQCYKLWGRTSSDCQDCPTVLARKTGQAQSNEMTSQDGRVWQVSSHPIKDDKGKIVSVVEVSREITQSKRALENETRRLHEKGAISEIAMQLAKTTDEGQIFKLISQGIGKLAGNAVTAVSSFDSADSSLTVRELGGSSASLKKVNELLGKKAGRLKFSDIPPRIIKNFRMGRMQSLKGGLAEASFGGFPAKLINALISGLGIAQVYGMGLYCGQHILGAVIICQLGKDDGLCQDLIENFVNQSAMALARVRAEEDIKFAQDYFKAIIDNTSEIITILDSDGIIKFKSRSAARELGYQPEELVGKNVFDFIHPGDVPGLIVRFNQELLAPGKSIRLELRFKHKNGSWQTLDATGINLLNNPAVKGLVINSRNITERKNNELELKLSQATLKESELKYRELADALPQSVFETDRSGNLTYGNLVALEKFNYTRADLDRGLNIFQMVIPEDRKRARENFNRRAQGGEAEEQEYTALTKDGRMFSASIYATPVLKNGKFDGFRGVVVDISDSKAYSQELQKIQLRLKHLLTASPAVIYSVIPEKDFQVTYVSENVSSVLGYGAEEFLKEDHFWTERIHPDDIKKFKSDERILLRQGHHIFEYRLRHKDGGYRWIRDGMRMIYGNQGQPSEGIGYLVDITDLKQVEDRLVNERDIVTSIFDSSPDALIVSDLDGNIRDCNQAALKMLGMAGPLEPGQANIISMVENISRERFSEIKKHILKSGSFRDLSLILVGKKGGRILTEATISLVREAGSDSAFFVSTIRDVGERKRMEAALKDSEEKHRVLLDSIHSPILALDRDMRVLYCNKGYFDIIGKRTRELVGQKLLEAYPSFKATKSYQAYLKCLETGQSQQVEGKFNNRYLKIAVYPTQWGLLAVADDATESRLAHEQLEESRRKLETLMGNLPGMVYRCRNDKGWPMEITNQNCRELTGYQPDEIIANKTVSFSQMIHPQDREMVWDEIQNAVQKKQTYQLIYRIIARDGTEKWVWEQGQGVYDDQGSLQALEGFISDISERKRAEDALHTSEYQYRSTIDSLGDSIHVVDAKLSIMLTNQVFKDWNKKMGLTSEAVGRNIFDIYPYLPKDKVLKEYQKVFQGDQVMVTIEENSFNKNRIITETRKIPISENGKVVRVITAVRDITENKLAQESLRETETRLVALSDNIPNGLVYQIDSGVDGQQRNFTYISAGVEHLHGVTAQEVMEDAEAIYGQVVQEDREMLIEREAAAVKQMSSFSAEVRMRMPSGIVRWSLFISSPRRLPNKHLSWDGIEIDITESKLAQEKLKESEANYRALFDQASDGIMFMSIDGSRLIVNDSFARMHGYGSRAEMEHIRLEDLDTPESAKLAPERLRRMIAGESLQFEAEHFHKDGHPFSLQVSCSVIRIGEQSYFLGFHQDISKRKLAEDELRSSEMKYRILMDQANDAIFVGDPETGRLVDANLKAQQLIGRTLDEILKMNQAELHPANQREKYQKIFRQHIKGGKAILPDLVVVHKDGRQIPVEISANLVDIRGRKLLQGIFHDLSERQGMESALKESEEKYRQIFNGVAEGIYRSTPEGKVLMVNPALVRMLGYSSAEELMQRDIASEGYADMKIRQQFLSRIEKDGAVTDLVSEWRRKDGSLMVSRENAHAVRDPSGNTLYYEGTVEDITEKSRAEEALRASEYQYRTTIDSLGDAIHVVDRDLRIILANRLFIQWCRDMKLTPEVINKDVFEVCPFLAQQVREEYETVFRTQKVFVSQEKNEVAGRSVVTETRKVPILENGRVIRVITLIKDITEQKEAESAGKQNEQRYKALADSSPDLVFVIDRQDRIKYANNRAASLVGLAGEQAIGRNLTEFFPQHINQVQQEQLREVFEKGRAAHYELPTPVGDRVMWLETWLVPLNDEGGTVQEVMGVCRDLTDRINMENALKDSEEKYRQIFEGISEGIYRSTNEGKLLFANPSLIRMLGYKNPEDVQGLDLNNSVYLDKKTRERFIRQIEKNGEVVGFEAELSSRDGTVRTVRENARLVKDESGKPLYYEGTLEDITVRKKAELSLKGEKDKLEHLFKVGLSVARAQTLQEKLDLTIKGIADCRLFHKAVMVLEDNGYRSHIAQYGLRAEEVENIEKSPVNDAPHKAKIFLDKYRRSNSYFIPHGDAEVHKNFAARFVSQNYQSNGTWHRDDVLIVPLVIKGVTVGYLSVDEPWDGNIPGIETVHLLELFANQAAIAIENIRLYNDLERSYYDTLKAFVAAMDAKDPYTKGHSENVRHYALKIARHIGLSEDKLRLVDYSSLLHDIGKLGIREDILAKPDVLSTAEFQEVKLHPVIGSRLVLEIDALSHTGEVIYCHHEYYDGSGYPRGIKGDDIPLEARIIAVADAFEAMTSDRPYRKAFSFQVALQRLQDAAGTQFDHKIVNAFTELFRRESGIKEGD